MNPGALVFLTEQFGNPGAIARECENLGFESFFVAYSADQQDGARVRARCEPLLGSA